jgi:hypothetical protein
MFRFATEAQKHGEKQRHNGFLCWLPAPGGGHSFGFGFLEGSRENLLGDSSFFCPSRHQPARCNPCLRKPSLYWDPLTSVPLAFAPGSFAEDDNVDSKAQKEHAPHGNSLKTYKVSCPGRDIPHGTFVMVTLSAFPSGRVYSPIEFW